MFQLMDAFEKGATIKVIGVGGGGGNAVKNMLESGIEGVEFICANTDSQALHGTGVKSVIQLGGSLTKGLGAGANPEVGREAAMDDRDRIKDMISGSDMLFITAGMGGGTGTGAAPVVAEIARDMGILTVAVVTKPFPFEGAKRMRAAEAGIAELIKHVDSLITIPNQKLLTSLGKNVSLLEAFKAANNVLLNAVQGIAELITNPGLINVDFADVRTVMSGMGVSMMGMGRAQGEDRAAKAAAAAISSPLLEDIRLDGAKGILVNITAGMDMGIHEFEEVGEVIRQFASDEATVVVGTAIDNDMRDEVRVTLVATGLEDMPSSVSVAQRPNGQGQAQAAPKQAAAPAPSRQDKIRTLRPVVIDTNTENLPIKDRGNSSSNGRSYDRERILDIPAFLRNQAD
ncbi:cell division protein FtsZ [Thiofilum flexile]|uniref:cell division protein FtsZ n=1 Tax=Thiofilum flexile TaxID=125627 RepID=UPI00037D9ACF|nr:cell division protein FtsZ [Thiofilum flexile]